ncbi:lytic transglycosylase domain-containing protein [Sinomonas sp. P10A9]|uniref:Lytic transglycosylase domain-containing protein n=1 Tax=Sinomonas puerhi TaxID=3238584 RepID=A0AB39L6N7_9MICC
MRSGRKFVVGRRFGSIRSALVVAVSLACVAPAGLSTAVADDGPPSGYPTWADVQAAKASVDSTKAETDRIGSLLTAVEATASDASAKAVAAGAASAKAAQAVKDQEHVVAVLDQEAAKRAGERDVAQRAAGQLAADSYMGGAPTGPIETLAILGQQDGLGRLQTLQVLGDQTAQAVTDYRVAANAATAAEDTAKAAKDALDDLAAAAAQRLSEARDAQKHAQDVVAQTQQHEDTLLAQLADLKGSSASVEQGFREGQAAQAAYEAAQEAKRRAAEEAAALRAQQLAQQQQQALAQQQEAARQRAQAPAQHTGAAGAASSVAAAPAAPVAAPVVAPLAAAPLPAVSPGAGVVNDPAGARAYASGQLGGYGWGSGEYGCLVKLWNQESSWMTDATNPSSGAYGIAQALPPSKYSTAGSDWLTNYRTQINWGLGYIANRYGSPCNAWAHEVSYNWY